MCGVADRDNALAQGRLVETPAGSELWTPAVLLSTQDSGFGPEDAQKALEEFGHPDDVLSDDFSSTPILQPSRDIDTAGVATRLAGSSPFRTVYINAPAYKHGSIQTRPYFIHGKWIHQTWKLYEDDLDAFVIPTIADDVLTPKRLVSRSLY